MLSESRSIPGQKKMAEKRKSKTLLDYFSSSQNDEPATSTDLVSEEEEEIAPCDSQQNESLDSEQPEKKAKYDHTFQTTWLDKYPWLRKDSKGMTCALCIKHKKSNTMTRGCDNYRTSTLTGHITIGDHKDALIKEGMTNSFTKVCRILFYNH